jgi:phage head maturation protease
LSDVKENWSNSQARDIAELAIDDAEFEHAISFSNSDGKLASICSYKTSDNGLRIDNLASNEKGYGRKTMQEVCKVAVKQNVSMNLTALPDAVGFYNKIGMTNAGSVFGGGTKFTWSVDDMKTFINAKIVDNEPKNGCFVKTNTKRKEVKMLLPNDVKNKIDDKEKQVRSSVFTDNPKIVQITEDECRKLCDAVGFTFKTGYEKRVIERIVTTETVDRDGDIVRCKGVDNKEYRSEPVILFAHDKYNVPVGRSLKEWIDNTINGWRSWDMYFNTDIDTTGKSDLVFRMVNSGAMRGGSIGFIPKEVKYDHSNEDRIKLGLGKYGVEFVKVKKIEHSVCSIPANQEALAASLKSLDSKILKGALTKSDLDTMEKNNMLEGNMIDVFYSVLGVQKTIIMPPTAPVEKEKEEVSFPVVNLNIDMNKTNESLVEITKKITDLNNNIDSVQKSLIERFNSLIGIAEKLISTIELKSETNQLYDHENTKDIENILKLK